MCVAIGHAQCGVSRTAWVAKNARCQLCFIDKGNSKRSHAASQNVMPCGLRKVGLVNSPMPKN